MALFIGGPFHGQYRAIDPRAEEIRAPVENGEAVLYRRDHLRMAGFGAVLFVLGSLSAEEAFRLAVRALHAEVHDRCATAEQVLAAADQFGTLLTSDPGHLREAAERKLADVARRYAEWRRHPGCGTAGSRTHGWAAVQR